jgi:hypothetical protein
VIELVIGFLTMSTVETSELEHRTVGILEYPIQQYEIRSLITVGDWRLMTMTVAFILALLIYFFSTMCLLSDEAGMNVNWLKNLSIIQLYSSIHQRC